MLNELVYSNYDDIRNKIKELYVEYHELQDKFDKLFLPELEDQFVAASQAYVTNFIAQRTVLSTDVIKLFVEENFGLKTLEIIVKDDHGM